MISTLLFIQFLIPSSLAFLSDRPALAFKLTSSSSQHLLPAEATNWIATIDSDIANIPQNEFAPVFMGGLGIIFGGFASCFIVAFILDRFDLYKAINGSQNLEQQKSAGKEVWRDMPEESKILMEELTKQLQAKEKGGDTLTKMEQEGLEIFSLIVPSDEDEASDEDITSNVQDDPSLDPLKREKQANIFSDYD
mmetsp:Transcript_25518/g.37695  ORF Transcript_25518/g.37695 Transcript_25518/m.37695 type:complete len:194 (+) Transcript_25518:112-693(+)|eukprot:CAMPEP_0194213290 /NCGR_PEP_ID=MMETSP0156-20130528/13724_1 /TAXON_ID=33649 /ORGANISM="Thalassionema nitzschioides, Strain L26-B" /LENGTH=193 /DNA_ID=CAMNT_0038941283 /DNA_START=104 /DNA_END=685 /DNA_ORIENTATION=-